MTNGTQTFDSPGAATAATVHDAELERLAERLPPMLSVIAGMVDLTGFLTLGNIFTAHITGNLVLATATAVRGSPLNVAQALAIPVFMLAVAATWLIARLSNRHGPALMRLLLTVQFALLVAVAGFCIVARPSTEPHGLLAGIAVMVAVSAMACQYALLRLGLPKAVSTAVMTGNLTNAVLSLLNVLTDRQSLAPEGLAQLKSSLRLLVGFLVGCAIAAVAVSFVSDWAWLLPVVLAAFSLVAS